MNNMQKSLKAKQKFQKGLCMAAGGLLDPSAKDQYGNDMTRNNQMKAVADQMEADRLRSDAEFAARMTQPVAKSSLAQSGFAQPVMVGPSYTQRSLNQQDALIDQNTALGNLSNADRYRLGKGGTAGSASRLWQRTQALENLRNTTSQLAGQTTPTQPLFGLRAGQDSSFYADGTASIYPRERERQPEPEKLTFMGHLEKIGGLMKKAYQEATGQVPVEQPKKPLPQDIVGAIKQRQMDNINARDYDADPERKFADGTASIDPVEELLARMKEKYGVPNNSSFPKPVVQTAQPPVRTAQQAQQPTPAPQAAAQPTEPRRGLREALARRDAELKKVLNYSCGTASVGHTSGKKKMADGGFVDDGENYKCGTARVPHYKCGTSRVGHAEGGIVHGKGGPTDDEVEMSIGGTKVNLSPREAVLPVKTVMALGGPEAVEELIEATNGKPPVPCGLRQGGKYAMGAGGIEIPDDYMRGRQPPPVQNTVPPLTPEQEMLKRAAASRAADAQARAAQEARQAAWSAEAGMRTPGGAAQAAPSRMSNLRAALNPANATKIEDIPRLLSESRIGSKLTKGVTGLASRSPGAGSALAGIEGAVRGLNTTDAEYAQRLGVDEPTTWLGSMAVRAPGVLSDVGASAINALALPYNAVRHGLDFDNYYDYRNNFSDVAAAKEAAPNAPVVAAKQAATQQAATQQAATQQAATQQAAAQQAAAQQAAPISPAADIAARSQASEKLRSFAQNRMNLPPTQQQDVVNGGSLVQRGNAGLRAIANDLGTMNALNEANSQQGTGVSYSTVMGADGRPQVMISGGPATKAQYLDTKGNPTNDWTQTSQYAEAQARNTRDRQRLKEIQAENTRSDLASALPFYQNRGLRTLQLDAQNGGVTPYQAASLDLQRQSLMANLLNRNEDNRRADAAAQQSEGQAHLKEVDDLLRSWASEGGKLDDQKYSFIQKYASQFPRGKGETANQYMSRVVDNYAIDTMGDKQGRYLFAQEDPWNGERTMWKKGPSTGNLRRGAPFQDIEYRDPRTDRVIYESDLNNLPPRQKDLFKATRVYE